MVKSERISPFVRQCFVTALVSLNVVGHNTSMAISAVLLPQLRGPGSALQLSKEAESWVVSIPGIALLFGNFLTPPLMEKYGRRIAHMVVTVPINVGWIFMLFATNVEVLLIGRTFQGISFGMLLPLRTQLIGEYTSPKNRGAFLATITLSQGFGVFLVHIVGSFMSWKITAIICMIFPFVSLIMTIYAPESPSWLVTKGRYEECKRVFQWLRGDEEEAELDEMIKARTEYVEFENMRKALAKNKIQDFKEVILKREVYVPIILMIHLYFMNQFSGGTLMANYSIEVTNILLGPEFNAYFWMVTFDIIRIIANFAAIFIINKVKRRIMLYSTGILNSLTFLSMAAYVYLKSAGILSYNTPWLPITLLILQVLSISIGTIPLPGVISGEVFPLEYRSIASSISLISFSAFYFLVTKTFFALLNSIDFYGTYLLYFFIIVYSLLVSWFLLPETMGKTLTQIENEFRGKVLVNKDALSIPQQISLAEKNVDTPLIQEHGKV